MDHVKRERSQRLGLLGLFLLAALLLVYACSPASGDISDGGPPRTRPFSVQGDVNKALLPGARAAPINVRVTNPTSARMVVTSLAVTVNRIAAPRATTRLPCTRRDFAVRQAPDALKVTIAAHSRTTLSKLDVPRRSWPRIGMLNRDKNQDGCQQSTLTLGYTALGRQRR